MPITVDEFEAARPHLLSVAYRMLGSAHDAQDAVQTAWLRATAARADAEIASPAAWLRTITANVCLDELRVRRRRAETPWSAVDIPADQLAADETFLRRDGISRALLVLLNQLTPPQRVAYVLHDLFSVPFEQIAAVLDLTPSTAKKHASRARQRLGESRPVDTADAADTADHRVVEAFLAAARTGDTRAMIRLLAPDSVRDADAALLPHGARTRVVGAEAIATETHRFRDRLLMTCPITVNGEPVHLIAPGGRPLATIRIAVLDGKITRITLRPAQPDAEYTSPVR